MIENYAIARNKDNRPQTSVSALAAIAAQVSLAHHYQEITLSCADTRAFTIMIFVTPRR